jgi:chaperonin cofactor prefoldin
MPDKKDDEIKELKKENSDLEKRIAALYDANVKLSQALAEKEKKLTDLQRPHAGG